MITLFRGTVCAALVVLIAGCGAHDEQISFCGIVSGSGKNATVESRATYPEGPFGVETCSVI